MKQALGERSRPLAEHVWQNRAREHAARVLVWTEPRRLRRARAQSHPVHDFLFNYYRYSTRKLEEWHPGPGEGIQDSPAARERFLAPQYQASDGTIHRDPKQLSEKARHRLQWTVDLLTKTQSRDPWLGCFGVHEWAMVYGGEEVRHADIAPLRVPQREINRFVEDRPIVCTHFDAFRFFAPKAQPMNRVELALRARAEFEQPGCIHANMDLYKWSYKSMPWIGSDLLWAAFELATQLRELDMRASPYDLRPLGFEPVEVETPAGRAEYRRIQEDLSVRAQAVRSSLIETIGVVLAS